jgi:hypothetical protein
MLSSRKKSKIIKYVPVNFGKIYFFVNTLLYFFWLFQKTNKIVTVKNTDEERVKDMFTDNNTIYEKLLYELYIIFKSIISD